MRTIVLTERRAQNVYCNICVERGWTTAVDEVTLQSSSQFLRRVFQPAGGIILLIPTWMCLFVYYGF